MVRVGEGGESGENGEGGGSGESGESGESGGLQIFLTKTVIVLLLRLLLALGSFVPYYITTML